MDDVPTAASLEVALEQTGWTLDNPLELLHRSGNNRVHRGTSSGRVFLAKEYFQHPDDSRDRYRTEKAFHDFLARAGIHRTPAPLAWFEVQRVGLFEFIEGTKPESATAANVQTALQFFLEINRHHASASELPTASEACFTLEEHVARIDHRVRRLENLPVTSDLDGEADNFVRTCLIPQWRAVGKRLESALLRETGERCISPSDFGFHNTLVDRGGRMVFFDFEYAGWDDPAKTVCDFFCQPAVPVPLDFLDGFTEAVGGARIRRRVDALLPAYRIKWCCILLNEFLAADRSRRDFSDPGSSGESRKALQFGKACLAFHRWFP